MADDHVALPLFEEEGENQPQSTVGAVDPMMSETTRAQVRRAFERLGVTTAREQFVVVAELTGQRITSAAELTQKHAQLLLVRLTRRAESLGTRSTGNAWADREEDTWIDKM